jgi:Ca-activated chloride channel family protein
MKNLNYTCKLLITFKALFTMQAKIYVLFLILCSICFTQLFAQTNLTVSDPQRAWRIDQGVVEEATFEMHPQGIYTAIDMYLTFSAKGLGYQNSDTLEVVLDFELPGGSIMIDSWLWIDDIIVKADILDRWTASGIYEEIVGRRQDPSILFKNRDGQFQLRIFPMAGDRARKVKLSYLIPTTWAGEQVLTDLPYQILQASRLTVQEARIRVFDNEDWGEPALTNGAATQFERKDNAYWEAIITPELMSQRAQVAFASPMEGGVYVNHYEEGSGGFYQLAFIPEKVFGVEEVAPKRIVVLLENIAENASISKEALLNQVEQRLLAQLSPNDYFNVMVSELDIAPVAPQWIAATPQAIRNAFDAIRAGDFANYSSLPTMLGAAINFIQGNGNGGEIMLVANSSEVGEIATANQLIQDIQNSMDGDMIPVHVCDYQQRNFRFFFSNNNTFRGNEYFYSNIARVTAGSYVNLTNCCASVSESLERAFEGATALNGTLDLHTRLANGLCYNRYNINDFGELVNFKRPIFQVGKYEGTFPFIIETVGSLQGNLLSANITLDESEVERVDTLAKQAWVGNFIQSLEKLERTNDVVSRIINESINERVLSLYTAFIALEPSLGGEPCLDCVGDDQTTVSAEEVLIQDVVSLRVAPNPFRDRARIVLELAEGITDLDDWNFAIYDLTGRQVTVFEDIPQQVSDRLELVWEAGSDVAPGVYLLIVQSPKGRHTVKLVKL